uniref:Cysteine-rich protein 1 n=1 Tax=Mola mola TaxID=94237 RepID=A0A3Q3WB63_MOLML
MVGYCPICGKPVYFGERKRSLGRDYHPLCLKCQKCKRQLTSGQHAEYDEKPYCPHCYLKMFGPKGTAFALVTHSQWHPHVMSECLFSV